MPNLQTSPQNFITIKGIVSDFQENPINNACLRLVDSHFTPIYSTYSNEFGEYVLTNIKRGRYLALMVFGEQEYPHARAVPEKDMRLEFWAWNIVAEVDLIINPHYHRLELYSTIVFQENGGVPGFFIYTRPMSLSKAFNNLKNSGQNKDLIDVSIEYENIKFNVFANEEPLNILSISPLRLKTIPQMISYLIHVDSPRIYNTQSLIVFKIVAENIKNNELGENLYFWEKNGIFI